MEKQIKKSHIAIVLAVILVVAVVIDVIFINKTNPQGGNGGGDKVSFAYNYAKGSDVKARVENAQYLPSVDKLATSTGARRTLSADHVDDLAFDLEDYQGIVDELAIITGTATRLNTTIWDIKEEIYTVLNMVPAFDQWFQLPRYFEAAHAQDGFNYFYYKINYDANTEKITITRMTCGYTCDVYDSKNDKIYSSYYDDDIAQYQVMQASYYYNYDDKEVVECSVVDFAKFGNSYYPIQCQYLENVEDTSTTKIQSVIRKELNIYQDKLSSNPGGNVTDALDVDTYVEGGVMRKFVQLNYSDYNYVELIKIEQNFATDYYCNANTTNLAYYLKQGADAFYFTDAWDYYDAASVEPLELVDNFEINNVATATKDVIIKSFKNSQYHTRQVLGTGSSSSVIVCRDCYNRTIDSGIAVYKCNHNKNQDNVARNATQFFTSSGDYEAITRNLLSWKIMNHLNRFAWDLGVPESIIDAFSYNICVELDDSYKFESSLDKYITAISKNFIEDISLTENVKEIYETVMKQHVDLEVEDLNKNEISTVLEVKNVSDAVGIQDNEISVSASAEVVKNVLLEYGAEYSLSLALYNDYTCYILMTDYVAFTGKNLTLSCDYSYDLNDFKIAYKDLNINKIIELQLGLVLTKRGKVNDIVCSDYHACSIPQATYSDFESTINGFKCKYIPMLQSGKLVVSIYCTDIVEPSIEIDEMENNDLILERDLNIYDLLVKMKILDNDVVMSVIITHNGIEYGSFGEQIVSGEHKITVCDRSGNMQELEFTIALI